METATQGQLTFHENDQGPMPVYPPRMQRWHELKEEYPYLRVIDEWQCIEGPPPKPLDRAHFLALLGTLQSDPHRQVLAELLLDLLADGIVNIVQALHEKGAT